MDASNVNFIEMFFVGTVCVFAIIIIVARCITAGKLLQNSQNNFELHNYDSPLTVGSFLMKVNEVFSITGRGVIVTGNIEKGTINIGDEIMIAGRNIRAKVAGIEISRRVATQAQIGDNVGLLLQGIDKNKINSGEYIVK